MLDTGIGKLAIKMVFPYINYEQLIYIPYSKNRITAESVLKEI